MKRIEISLGPKMFRELQAVSRENELTPQSFAAECVESVLASRRLPTVRPSVSVARMAGTVETAMLAAPRAAECRAVIDPPLLADLDALEGVE